MDVAVSELLRKPYTRVLTPDAESGTFTAQVLEFPGCIAQGDNPAEAYERLEAAAESWIEAALEMHQTIPQPATDGQFGGKFALRLPRSLHRQAAQLAELDGTSLNQFIVATLAERVGAVNIYRRFSLQLNTLITGGTGTGTVSTARLRLPEAASGRPMATVDAAQVTPPKNGGSAKSPRRKRPA
jgi:predicted RNase H-like HicB family nuclease